MKALVRRLYNIFLSRPERKVYDLVTDAPYYYTTYTLTKNETDAGKAFYTGTKAVFSHGKLLPPANVRGGQMYYAIAGDRPSLRGTFGNRIGLEAYMLLEAGKTITITMQIEAP